MKHKKVAAALSAAVAGASVLAGILYAAGKRKPKKGREPDLQEEGLTEGKLRECLLRLFRLYEDSEFDDSAEFWAMGVIRGNMRRRTIPASYSLISKGT